MERTWELMGLNDGWKSEKVKVFGQNLRTEVKKKLLILLLRNYLSQHHQYYNLLV